MKLWGEGEYKKGVILQNPKYSKQDYKEKNQETTINSRNVHSLI